MHRILVVDDEQNLTFLLESILESKGYEVETANSGPEAIEKAQKKIFDICLLDIRMPGMNGVDVFMKMKEISPLTRVIMMTAYAVEDLIEVALNEGAYACVHKPFDIDDILRLVEEALKTKKRVILIVDNVEKFRSELIAILKDRYVIYEAKSGKEAIDKSKEIRYDIIFIDYGLPDMDGLVVFREIKKICPDAVAILVLDKYIEDLVSEALKAGFYGCIPKPVDKTVLLNLIERVFEK